VTKDSMSAYWKRLRGQNLWTKYVSDMKTVWDFDIFIGGDCQE
jgi:hypothetical protein